jgi:hypothetical protein
MKVGNVEGHVTRRHDPHAGKERCRHGPRRHNGFTRKVSDDVPASVSEEASNCGQEQIAEACLMVRISG